MASISNSITRIPTALFNEPNRIFFEMPSGKIGKDGKLTIQKGQKKYTCLFYTMKRLLTTEQIRSEHGQICSRRRKTITAAGTEFSSLDEHYKSRTKANETFFKEKKLDPKKAARGFWSDTLKQGMAEIPAEFFTPEMMEQIMAQTRPVLAKVKPWYQLEHMEGAADQLMARGHGLKEVPCKDLATVQGMIKTLQTKGPLMINGRFGKHFYAGKEPEKFDEKIGTHALYGWKKGTPTSEVNGIGHSIVLIGAEVKDSKKYVYWINPEDSNNPADPDSQKVYISSFESIATRMVTLAGLPMDQMTPESKAIIGGALYNPAFIPR
jgi:hypothetical protein